MSHSSTLGYFLFAVAAAAHVSISSLRNKKKKTFSLHGECEIDKKVRLWAKEHGIPLSCDNSDIDAAHGPTINGLYYPTDVVNLRAIFDSEVFPKFDPIARIGRAGFADPASRNSSSTSESVLIDAEHFKPVFKAILSDIVTCTGEKCYAFAGVNDVNLVKQVESMKTKLHKVRDVLRASIICDDILTLENSLRNAVKLCKDKAIDFRLVNFYENRVRFGDMDRADNNYSGYFSCHLTIVLQEDRGDEPPRRLLSEIQFHISSIFNRSGGIKDHTHPIYKIVCEQREQVESLSPEERETLRIMKAATELYYSYGMSNAK